MDAEQNRVANQRHFEWRWGTVALDEVCRTVENHRAFLADATVTDTSWYGLYLGGFADRLPGRRVLELGCGQGTNALVMGALGAEVVAVDLASESRRIIEQAAARLGIRTVQALTGDASDLELDPGSFDFVVGKAFLHHLTHEQESRCLARVAEVLKPEGEARFFEPAVNSPWLDRLRWAVPVPGRPSSLQKEKFARWKDADPHPDRDNSSAHYARAAARSFGQVRVVPIGSLERFCRLLPQGELNRAYRRWAHRTDLRLPEWFRVLAARSQLIVCREPGSVSAARAV